MSPWSASFAVLALALLAGCAHAPQTPDPAQPLDRGLATLGRIRPHPETGPWKVVLIKDRHSTHGAITRVRGRLGDIQRENRLAVSFLVQKGFSLLGCEAALGPLPEGEIAGAHAAAVRRALEERDNLDRLTVYQPIRYAVEFEGRLTVLGVEDRELYEADVACLERINDVRPMLARSDTSPEERRELLIESRRLMGAIRERAAERGRRAAGNLLALMESRRVDRAILLIGGAHVPSASRELSRRGVPHLVFECRHYDAQRGR